MHQQLKIAQLNDLESINQLLRLSKAYWGYDETFMDRFMQKFGMTSDYLENNITRLFYVNEKLAGFFSFSLQQNGTYELDNFFLHPDCIGQGYGRKLWQTCCQTANDQGLNEFILWSDPNAEHFYLAMGCMRIGTRQSPLLPNRHLPILKYTLLDSRK